MRNGDPNSLSQLGSIDARQIAAREDTFTHKSLSEGPIDTFNPLQCRHCLLDGGLQLVAGQLPAEHHHRHVGVEVGVFRHPAVGFGVQRDLLADH